MKPSAAGWSPPRKVSDKMAWRRSPGRVRVSFAALLRVKVDDRYVLFDAPARPGAFGPPGGVFKYFQPATRLLEGMGFREDRIEAFSGLMRFDLRGFLPAPSVETFRRWFATGAYREDSAECLSRELREELAEVGLGHLISSIDGLVFDPVRTVMEGPHPVPGACFRQFRRFEVHDLVIRDSAAEAFRRELIRVGDDGTVPKVVCARAADIRYGRVGASLISGHTAYLVGAQRTGADVPTMR